MISGDADFETEQTLQRYLWVTRLVHKFAPDAPLAFHLKGWSDALPQELAEYAALYLYQSGHNPAYQYTARTLAESFRARIPQKPVLNSEPCYEQMGYSRLAYGRHRREDCRRILWTSLLSGACAGITYGAHGVWNWYKPDMPENPSAARDFASAFARTLWGCPAQRISHLPDDYVRIGADGILPLPGGAACLPRGDSRRPQRCAHRAVSAHSGTATTGRYPFCAKIYFIDLETRKTLPAHCLYKSGVLHLEQAPCYRDALLIIEGESPC